MDIIDNQVASLEAAKQKTNSKFVPPSYLPAGYQIQIIEADPDGTTATILASPNNITQETTDMEFFWKDKGILIYYNQKSSDYDWMTKSQSYSKDRDDAAVDDSIRAVVLPPKFGMSISGDPVPILGELLMDFGDRWTVEIRADLPAEELIKIAKSIQQ
jgi:hypothetical protein